MTALIILILLSGVVWLGVKLYKYNRKNAELVLRNNQLVYQKKSSEVRLGKTVENVAPFFDEWPYDSGNFRFLGNPIDGISFNDDEIVFVEIKTGMSRLSKNQTKVKSLIKDGKVKFITFRVNEKGIAIKDYSPQKFVG
jgi:predicted Holliday junction resolvase-like endonuclease